MAKLILSLQPQYIKNASHWDAYKWIWDPYEETTTLLSNLTPPNPVDLEYY